MSLEPVLIIDADPDFRRTLSDILSASGYAPVPFAESQAALDWCAQHTTVVALVELKLRDRAALDLLKVLQERPSRPEIIFLTTDISQETAAAAADLGAFAYFRKPCDIDQLLFSVRKALDHRRAAEALLEKEKSYRSAFENTTVGLYRTTPDGRILMANPAMLEMLGYESFDELAQRDLNSERFEPGYEREDFLRRIESEGKIVGLETAWVRCDGTALFVQESSAAVRDEAGKTLYYEGTAIDISRHKWGEDVLKKRFEELSVLHEIAMLCVETRDEDLLIERVTQVINERIFSDNLGVLLLDEEHSVLVPHYSYQGIDTRALQLRIPIGEGVSGFVAAEGIAMRVPDVREEPRYLNVSPLTRSELCVPLSVQKRILGVINTESRQLDAFTPGDQRLLTTLGNQLAIALERIRLSEETKRRMKDTKALLASAQAAASLDLDDVLGTIARHARAMFEADGFRIHMLEADGESLTCLIALHERAEEIKAVQLKIGQGFTGRVAESGRPEVINDTRKDPHAIQVPGTPVEAEAVAVVPLKARDQVIGVMTVTRLGLDRPFVPADMNYLLAFAQQASTAIDNAALFENVQSRLRDLNTLYQSGLLLSRLQTRQEIAQCLVDVLEEHLDWHHATVREYNPEDGTFTLLAFHAPHEKSDEQQVAERFQKLVANDEQGLSGWAARQGHSLRVGDLSKDSHYVDTYPGLQSGLYVPIRRDDRILGVISVESENPHSFSQDDERLLSTLAQQAASAFENASLFRQTRQRADELEALNRISTALRVAESMDQALPILLDGILAAVEAEDGSILLYQSRNERLVSVTERGWFVPLKETGLAPGEGIGGKVFEKGTMHISTDFSLDEHSKLPEDVLVPSGWGGACLPIQVGDNTSGVIFVSKPSSRPLTGHQIRLLEAIADIAGVTIHRLHLRDETQRRLNYLRTLRTIEKSVLSSMDLTLILNILLDQVLAQLDVDAATVLLSDESANDLYVAAARGLKGAAWQDFRIQLGVGLAGQAALERRIVHIPDLRRTDLALPELKYVDQGAFVGYFGVPLIAKGRVEGVLEMFHRSKIQPDDDWADFLKSLAGQAAMAIDNARLFDSLLRSNTELSKAYDSTLEGWAKTLELRDRETEGHSQRIAELAVKLARALGIPNDALVQIRRGALLHDIGKLGIPDSILQKPGKLTAAEWEIMRQHPRLAYDALSGIDFLQPALDIPYCHHEKWDGTGYPRGLKEEEIPLPARIFAVVDVWDALTSDRPYRKAWSVERTLAYIREQSGQHFDPHIVDAFLRLKVGVKELK